MTMEPQNPGNSPRPGPEVLCRKGVAEKRVQMESLTGPKRMR